MTSSRGQNVSAFQRPGSERWKPPIAAFTDTGRSLPRNNSLGFGKYASATEKNSNQHVFKCSSTEVYASVRNKESNSLPNSTCSNILSTSRMNYSSTPNSSNRELSPVRWCDRKVDGVYLGRSGWVQVQQRSLDDGRGVFFGGDNSNFSTLSSRKHFSGFDPDFSDGRECNRPINLPLASKKRAVRDNYERPSKFVQEVESISPPSVTPIISPPPAFKDDGLSVEFPGQSIGVNPFYCEESVHLGLTEGSCPPKERRSILQLKYLPSEMSVDSVSTIQRERLRGGTFEKKSPEDYFSNRGWRNRRFYSVEPFPSVGFRSIDDDVDDSGTGGNLAIKVCDSDSFCKNFDIPKENINSDECDYRDAVEGFDSNKMATPNGSCSEFRNSSNEESGQRNQFKAFRQRNNHRNGRRTSSTYRTRSSSSDSSSSSSNFSGKNSEKLAFSRRTSSKEKQTFEFENPSSRNSKQFHVKRSRSLQLSEKRSPGESILNNSSGKFWDPMPPDYLAFHIPGQNRESPVQFPHHLHHVLVTVSGDSIPVGRSCSQSLKSLNKITTSEEEQKKLIMEAEKEARIISEFLNGTRSRTAARNLIMHRYLNRHEGLDSSGPPENLPAKAEYNAHFLETFRKENFWKKNKSNSTNLSRQHPTAIYSKPSASLFQTNGTSNYTGSATLLQDLAQQRKKDPVDNKGSREYSSEHGRKDRRPKNKSETFNRFLDPTSATEKQTLRSFDEKQKPKNETLENAECLKGVFKNVSQIFPIKTGMGDFVESSSLSSSASPSSPPDVFQVDCRSKCVKKIKNTDASILFDNLTSAESTVVLRADGAPGIDNSIPAVIDQRSLSLPRSFLSERYNLDYSNQRDLFQWEHCGDEETLKEITGELPLNSQRSRTAPTTPTRNLRCGKSVESLSQIKCIGSSRTSLLDESPFSDPRRTSHTFAQENKEHSDVNSNEGSTLLINKNSQQMTENSSETVLQKLKKNFPLKYLKAKGHFKDSRERNCKIIENKNVENSYEAASAACRLISRLQDLESDDRIPEKALSFAKEQRGCKKGLKSEKYDSHDSGIQMGNRGNVDSSESQDTDLPEDFDSPVVVRKGDVRGNHNFCRTEWEIFSQALTDQLKADVRWPTKSKKHSSSPVRYRHAKTISGLPSPESRALRNKFKGSHLRRSLSQPLGLNELPPLTGSSISFAFSEDEKNPRGKNSDDECLSDSESSVASLQERKKSFGFATSRVESAILAEAVWDHVAIESCELPFKAGDVIEVLDTQNWDWWWGATAENKGYFPSAFVRLRVNQEDTVEDCLAAMAKGKYNSNRLRRGKSVSLLSNDQVRSSVVRELLNTEQDFVKILRDLKVGYIDQCKRRTDMFSSGQITSIFSNLEDLLVFQEKFFSDLEASVDKEFPYKSCIGKVFLTHSSGFQMYSEYCNSHPMAIATLQDMYQRNGYCKFFETCRLKQSLMEIPLDGYLLTPVQRICKYPLQLAELLKYTKPEHPDFREAKEALETMRGVATLINERKRKMESLEKLAAWQQRVEGWEGEDLIEISSRLIHQGDVVRITSGVWTTNITLFLFDRQIVYCKKDLLKRNAYTYKGRIFLDTSVVVDVPDGKNQQLGVTVKYGLKICSSLQDKWFLFCCRSSEDKIKWLEALEEEKRLVALDREVGLDLPPTAKRLAKTAARTKRCPPFKPSGKSKFVSNNEDMSFRKCHPSASKSKPSRRVGTWFTFGGVIKNSKASLRPITSLHRIT